MSKYSSYILYLLLTIFVVLLSINGFGPLKSLQISIDDLVSRMTAEEGTRDKIVIVAIDGPSFDKYGSWPWNHDLIGDLASAVSSGKPNTIVLDVELYEDASQDSAGHTKVLTDQLSWIDKVIIPYDIAQTSYRIGKTNNPKYLFNNSIQVENPVGLLDESSTLLARKVFLPAEKILRAKPSLGFEYAMPDNDRILRHQQLVMHYDGYYYPSISLIAAARFLNVDPDKITVVEGTEIKIGGERSIPINDKSELLIRFAPEFSFTIYSAAEVLSDGFQLSLLKDKLVLITVNDISLVQQFKTPVNEELSRYLVKANVIENIINKNFIEKKTDFAGLELLLLFLIGGICSFYLPQLTLTYRMIVLAIGFVILANVSYFMVSSYNTMIETVFFAAELFLFMLAAPVLDSKLILGHEQSSTRTKSKTKIPKAKLDKSSFEKDVEVAVREIKSSKDYQENLITAYIDEDRKEKRRDKKKESPSELHDHQAINIDDENNNDTKHASEAAGENEKTSVFASDSNEQPSDGLDFSEDSDSDPISDGIEKMNDSPVPTELTKLGRYQVTGTLGKGAMGHVYKGTDPAIDRPLALKTIRLDFVNDPKEMEDLKERLFREARAAGKLSHPNIVTIYDVGSEGTLQYIAMEYLEGQTLEQLIKKKTKFNFKIIAKITMQICNALQYAHDRNIVHRDIKPANIMIMKGYKIKIMDYGIARIDSSSMTKTGIAMGTPNYISPEQLQGLAVDSRADLFSLGVVLYELLLGKRPFKGENITSLIYSILNKDPEIPSSVVPQMPLLFDQIIDRALKKIPADRYQSADDMAADLNELVEAFAHSR